MDRSSGLRLNEPKRNRPVQLSDRKSPETTCRGSTSSSLCKAALSPRQRSELAALVHDLSTGTAAIKGDSDRLSSQLWAQLQTPPSATRAVPEGRSVLTAQGSCRTRQAHSGPRTCMHA
ncbi:Hypothetical predicted protein [Lynx pardinus]|uniref:Uncharacterized protein n=1 Tax=Lynx pardinus TaxID=191816 RepID=A0A485MD81_LYNPA|nr:Hypothetical predicted protein [Lynx pardinus]